jgi:hypothetical protein
MCAHTDEGARQSITGLLVVGIDEIAAVGEIRSLERFGDVADVLRGDVALVGVKAAGNRLVRARNHCCLRCVAENG